MMNSRPIMKPAARPHSSLAHQADSITVATISAAKIIQSSASKAMARAVRRSTMGVSQLRITLRCGSG
ncbi:hypothetical protein FQZ97_1170590 [compost metagenome]